MRVFAPLFRCSLSALFFILIPNFQKWSDVEVYDRLHIGEQSKADGAKSCDSGQYRAALRSRLFVHTTGPHGPLVNGSLPTSFQPLNMCTGANTACLLL